jgi:hypothetical protein
MKAIVKTGFSITIYVDHTAGVGLSFNQK